MDEGAFADGMGGRYNRGSHRVRQSTSPSIVISKDRIGMSEELFEEIRRAKRENYAMIYHSVAIEEERKDMMRASVQPHVRALPRRPQGA